DHHLTDRDDIAYRYHYDRSDQPNVGSSNTTFGSLFAAAQIMRRHNHAISYTHIFSSRFLNEARLAYTRGTLNFPENDPTSPTVAITDAFTFGGSSTFPQGRIEQTRQFQNIATYIANRNSLKFGLDLRRTTLFSRSGTHSKGTWTFNNLADYLNNSAV